MYNPGDESSSDLPEGERDLRTSSNDDLFSIAELGRAASKATRARLERIARERRSQVMQIIAVVFGAVIGALVDGLLFRQNSDDLTYRVIGTLFLGTVGALLGYSFVWRIAAFMRIDSMQKLQATANRALVVSLLLADLLPATWIAAGAGQGTLHGYAIVIVCEVIALALVKYLSRNHRD